MKKIDRLRPMAALALPLLLSGCFVFPLTASCPSPKLHRWSSKQRRPSWSVS